LLGRFALRRLAAEAGALLRNGASAASIAGHALGPHLPLFLWRRLRRLRGHASALRDYSLLGPGAAVGDGFDFSYRPRADSLEDRMGAFLQGDRGNANKGTLAGWGIDSRDPTADRRLAEFCLRVPLHQYLANGVLRALARNALADRVPETVLRPQRRGYQGADWIAGLTSSRERLKDEAARIARDPLAAGLIDTGRLQSLAESLPAHRIQAGKDVRLYRHALLRGVSMGHFLRKASRSND
jgi:asparagine synthase (glutamine-hydrolysing)